jgi:hypothetical protein
MKKLQVTNSKKHSIVTFISVNALTLGEFVPGQVRACSLTHILWVFVLLYYYFFGPGQVRV